MNAWKIPLPSGSNAPVKIAGIVYRKQIGLDCAGNIVFGEGTARQEERVNETIADDVVTVYCA